MSLEHLIAQLSFGKNISNSLLMFLFLSFSLLMISHQCIVAAFFLFNLANEQHRTNETQLIGDVRVDSRKRGALLRLFDQIDVGSVHTDSNRSKTSQNASIRNYCCCLLLLLFRTFFDLMRLSRFVRKHNLIHYFFYYLLFFFKKKPVFSQIKINSITLIYLTFFKNPSQIFRFLCAVGYS